MSERLTKTLGLLACIDVIRHSILHAHSRLCVFAALASNEPYRACLLNCLRHISLGLPAVFLSSSCTIQRCFWCIVTASNIADASRLAAHEQRLNPRGRKDKEQESAASSELSWSSGSSSSTASSELSDPDDTLHFLRQTYGQAATPPHIGAQSDETEGMGRV